MYRPASGNHPRVTLRGLRRLRSTRRGYKSEPHPPVCGAGAVWVDGSGGGGSPAQFNFRDSDMDLQCFIGSESP